MVLCRSPDGLTGDQALQQFQMSRNPIERPNLGRPDGQHRDRVRLDLRASRIPNHAHIEVERQRLIANGQQLLLRIGFDGDLGTTTVVPAAQGSRESAHGRLVGTDRCVTALGGDFAFAHFQVVAHDENHFVVAGIGECLRKNER